MSRAHRTYADRTAPATVFDGVDVTTPVAGFYKLKLSRETVLRAIRLWFGPPCDPVTGEEMDRSWRWMAELDDGALVDFDDIWPRCARDPISEAEWKRCRARTDWARQHAPDSAYAERGRKLDLLSPLTPLPF